MTGRYKRAVSIAGANLFLRYSRCTVLVTMALAGWACFMALNAGVGVDAEVDDLLADEAHELRSLIGDLEEAAGVPLCEDECPARDRTFRPMRASLEPVRWQHRPLFYYAVTTAFVSAVTPATMGGAGSRHACTIFGYIGVERIIKAGIAAFVEAVNPVDSLRPLRCLGRQIQPPVTKACGLLGDVEHTQAFAQLRFDLLAFADVRETHAVGDARDWPTRKPFDGHLQPQGTSAVVAPTAAIRDLLTRCR